MSWQALLKQPFDREPHRSTLARAEAEAAAHTVYPPREDWFAAFRLTRPEEVRVVILGQDPYYAPGQAMGLAFSVPEATPVPPSLRNIYQELSSDLGVPAPRSGDLTCWARQGVLLLNTVLTVEAGRANSHKDLGWQEFTDEVIRAVSGLPQPIAFVLWGAQAKQAFRRASGDRQRATGNGRQGAASVGFDAHALCREHLVVPGSRPQVTTERSESIVNCQLSTANCPGPRLVLESAHPSPLSAYRGFFGSKPFSRINGFLRENGAAQIDWCAMRDGGMK